MPSSQTQRPHGPEYYATLTEDLCRIALDAGKLIMEIYESGFDVTYKDDRSPVTRADAQAEKLILTALADLAPAIPVIAEEAASAGRIPRIENEFFLVDPLDGTKEFINRNGEFTVNIALIVDQVPQAGVVYAPALGRIFYSSGPGDAFEKSIATSRDSRFEDATARPLHATIPESDGLVVVASRSHRAAETDTYLERFKVKKFVSAGSSLKFCLVAAGEADLYPRHGRTMEWDTAAGHAVLTGAGGTVTREDATPLFYGKDSEGFANPYFIARGKTALPG